MSRRFTWGILVVLVGLLFASWWAVYQNKYQGAKAYVEGEKAQGQQQMDEAMERRNESARDQRKQLQASLKGQAIKKAATSAIPKKPSPPVDEPYIKGDWYLKRADGATGIEQAHKEAAEAEKLKQQMQRQPPQPAPSH